MTTKTEVSLLDLDTGITTQIACSAAVAELIADIKVALESIDDVALAAPAAMLDLFGKLEGTKYVAKKNNKVDVKGTKKNLRERSEFATFRDAVFAAHPDSETFVKMRKERESKVGEARKAHQGAMDQVRIKISNRCNYLISVCLDAYIAEQLFKSDKSASTRTLQERFDRAVSLLRKINSAASGEKGNAKIAWMITGMLDGLTTAEKTWSNKVAKSKANHVAPTLEGWASKAKADEKTLKAQRKQTEAAIKRQAKQPITA